MLDDRDKKRIYMEMVVQAFKDGSFDKIQVNMLIKLSEVLEVPYEMHCEVVNKVMAGSGGREEDDDRIFTQQPISDKETNVKCLEDWNRYIFNIKEEGGEEEENREIEMFGKEFLSPASPSYGIEKRNISKIAVVGIGGAGSNAVGKLYQSLEGRKITDNEIKVIAIDSHLQDLFQINVPHKIYIGEDLAGGGGTDGDMEIGRKVGELYIERFKTAFKGSDVVIVTFGMGGGMGSGTGPVLARAAKETGAKVIPIITLPFREEGGGKKINTTKGLNELKEHSDKILTIPNDLLTTLEPDLPLIKGFKVMVEILALTISRIQDLLSHHGDRTLNFFRGGGVLGVSLGHGNSLHECWNAIKEDLDRFPSPASVREALLFTCTQGHLDNNEYSVFKRHVERYLISAEKVINVKRRTTNAAMPIEIMALFGVYPTID